MADNRDGSSSKADNRSITSHRQQLLAEALAEFLGTTILMIFGMASVAQYVFGKDTNGSADQIRWAWGLAVTFGVYVSGNISGGHINPAVTLTLCLFKKTPWNRLIPYWVAQYLGSFTASCLVYGVYYDALNNYNNGTRDIGTAGIFSTYPQDYLSWVNGLGDQIFGTALLMLLVLALTDPTNVNPHPGYRPVLVGLVVVAIGMTLGQNCGYAINPARDLSPRIFTAIAGWGSQVFSHNDYNWFWIPVVGPHVGAILGGAVYELLIHFNVPCVPERTGSMEVNTNDHAHPHAHTGPSTISTSVGGSTGGALNAGSGTAGTDTPGATPSPSPIGVVDPKSPILNTVLTS